MAFPRDHRGSLCAVLAAAALALCACEPYVEGNGVFLEQDRSAQIGPFAGIHVDDGIEAKVASGATPQSVLVSGDANVVPYVRTEVEQLEVPQLAATVPVLHVWVDLNDFEATMPVQVVVKAADVRYLQVLDGASVDVRDVATTRLVVDAGRGAQAVVRGAGGADLDATLDDAALHAELYPVQTATVSLTARSSAWLQAEGAVIGSAAGASELDNQLGGGTCAVSSDATSIVTCQRYAPAGP